MEKMPWNRNRTRPDSPKVPAEVEEYYQSTKKERKGIAWLLSFATLALTLLIASGLYFGGRFIYRQIAGSNDEPTVGITDQEATAIDETAPESETENERSESLPSDSEDSGADESTEPDETQSSTPTTGPSSPEIPHTGPTSDE
jgi:cytoskeletal protein RodZ